MKPMLAPKNDHAPDCPQKSADVRTKGVSPGHGVKSHALRERAVLALLSEKTFAAAG
jgi:hypothetical protein